MNRRTILPCFLLALALSAQAADNRPDTDSETDKYVSFLYQYMPQPDQTDYSREFYEQNVALAMQARQEMPWGPLVPEREFRHFVLPVRVNNEHLDNSRDVFYAELKPRVQHLGMKEAILEVNHWCHEKVTYRPTDARTSSPLASVKTAYGRCGEESTFLVAALRAVGIPARQVYTPRWAHTDDNHAWVEAWADGQWWFLGACEPEPVLNLGWFNGSASRGMLMHTRVFGQYDGPEEVMSRSNYFTEINVTSTYAPTTRVDVQVVDAQGRPVPDALVEFKIYNYAEFFSAARKRTDQEGRTFLTAGRGDMLIWASKDGSYAFQKVSFDKPQTVTVALNSAMPTSGSLPEPNKGDGLTRSFDLTITPPSPSASTPPVTDAQRAANEQRKALEDSIRAAYERTMPREEWRGNYAVIQQFLTEQADTAMARHLLQVISAKDLRDISLEVLRDNMPIGPTAKPSVADGNIPPEILFRYVLSPRVENEHLVPFKHYFRQELARFIGKPAKTFAQWALNYVTVDDSRNPQNLRMSPLSVYRERRADQLSRNIFFVAAARSIGIPARINEINGKLQYWDGDWQEAIMESREQRAESKEKDTSESNHISNPSSLISTLRLTFSPTRFIDNPKYYTHFTLSKIEDGRLQLLNYPEEATWQNTFDDGVTLDAGNYLLVTGTRLANGSVLANMQLFQLQPGRPLTMPLLMREDAAALQVIGSLNAENLYVPIKPGTDTPNPTPSSLLATTGRGYYVVGVIAPNQEPTNHALRDIAACAKQLEQWGRKLILLFESEEDVRRFNFGEHKGLPGTVCWGIDKDGTILRDLQANTPVLSTSSNASLPVFVIADSFNRVVFASQGYTIGLGEQLIKNINKIED